MSDPDFQPGLYRFNTNITCWPIDTPPPHTDEQIRKIITRDDYFAPYGNHYLVLHKFTRSSPPAISHYVYIVFWNPELGMCLATMSTAAWEKSPKWMTRCE